MFPMIQRQAVSGVRRYSSQAAKAQSTLTSVSQKVGVFARAGVYYAKVAGEVAKYVWLKEGLSPPTVAEVQKTFTTDLKAFGERAFAESKNPTKLAEKARSWSKDDYIRGGAVVVQLLGLFSLGEIIGRRHVYGYKDHHHDEAHSH